MRPYGANFPELAWPVLGTTAVAVLVAILLLLLPRWFASVKPNNTGRQQKPTPGLPQLQEKPTPKPKAKPTSKELQVIIQESQEFVYDTLPPSSREPASHAIRLLRVHSSDANWKDTDTHQPIRCSLETFPFDTCRDYWALSYTWGPETGPSHLILVNGQRFRVRQNLFDFLTAFRAPSNDDFYLWIDQICINQGNIPERNSQVRRMGQYYDRAAGVITWLGVGTELELAAMARVKQVDVDNTPPSACKEPMTLNLLRGYRSIIANSYFERVWIVQEMARAKYILVMLGTKETPTPVTTSWRHFNFAFVQLLFERTIISTTSAAAQQELALRQEIRDRSGFLLQLLEVKKHQDATDIFELVEAFSEHKCADPRDKLYALQDIGHLPKQLFTIDYSKSKHQVYLDFLATCLKSAESGHTLSERQFDTLLRLGRAMGIQVEVQVGPADDNAEDVQAEAADLVLLLKESLTKLRESINYVGNRDVLIFGPRYDKKTGHRVSPLSKEAVRGRIPTTFRVPASVNLADISRMAKQDLSRRIGAGIHAESLAADAGGADTVGEPSTSDGYTTIVCLSGDISYWGLPPLDTYE